MSWIYIALETFGGMPAPVAVDRDRRSSWRYLALWPALAGWIAVRVTPADSTARLLAAAAAFTLCEWLRGWAFLGLTWFAIGNAELLPEGGLPLAGFAPTRRRLPRDARGRVVRGRASSASSRRSSTVACVAPSACLAAIAVLVVAGERAAAHSTGRAAQGAPVAVSLLQGNVSQAQKFDPAFRPRNYELLRRAHAAAPRDASSCCRKARIRSSPTRSRARCSVRLAAAARARDGGILVGLFVAEPPAEPGEGERIYNSVVSLGEAPPQLYRKHHLVPFGESIPLKPIAGWFINQVLAIPLADQARGTGRAAAVRGRGPADRGQHLLRGRVRRRAASRPRAPRRCSST